MKAKFIFPALLFFSSINYAQLNLKGRIIDAKSGDPIDAVNIFVSHTANGTLSNENGVFQLENLIAGENELVISHLAYQTQNKKITLHSSKPNELTIKLQPSALNLAEVNVTTFKSSKRKRYLDRFTNALLGSTRNAGKCSLLNPEAIEFQWEGNKLKATANQLIEIENRAMGYKLYFLLESFSQEGSEVSYSGKPFFQILNAANQKEANEWEKQRRHSYLGSSRHFYRSLFNMELEKVGWAIFHARQNGYQGFLTVGPALSKQILKNSDHSSEKILVIPQFLKVVYTKEKDTPGSFNDQMGRESTKLGQRAERDMIEQDRSSVSKMEKFQTSYLFARSNKVKIQSNGLLAHPELIIEYGYWSHEGLADLLPLEYGLDPPTKAIAVNKKQQGTPPLTMNGFLLNDLLIPKDEIKQGGPPRDGIPSIDRPIFTTVNNARFLQDKEYVLGVVINNKAKAYPIKIMDRHEIVNDFYDGKAVVVTYCPLCGSGMAFSAEIAGKRRSFGVSGLLYNSDVLLYDRETESLWSQIMSKAISGESSGQILDFIPTAYTTWGNWKSQYPNTLVLTTNTGFIRNYDQVAYEGYKNSSGLMFPVSQESNLYKKKDLVIGIGLNGKFKAYAFRELQRTKGAVIDQFAGETLHINYNPEAKSATIKTGSGKELPAVTLYWFAWYAFHPETEVYKR